MTNSRGHQRIAALARYLKQFDEQRSELQQFAYHGVRGEVSLSIGTIRNKKSDESVFLPTLQALYDNSKPYTIRVDISLVNLKAILESCTGKQSPINHFARQFCIRELRGMQHWINSAKSKGVANEVQIESIVIIDSMLKRYDIPKSFIKESTTESCGPT